MEQLLHKELSDKVLGMAFSVHNIIGPGLLESAYEGAFVIELEDAGLPFERQQVYPLHYKGRLASAYIADLVVDNKIIIELKSVTELHKTMEAQIINYLRLAKLEVGYLMNFHGTRLEWKRYVIKREGSRSFFFQSACTDGRCAGRIDKDRFCGDSGRISPRLPRQRAQGHPSG
jgi:GxxExxY protein